MIYRKVKRVDAMVYDYKEKFLFPFLFIVSKWWWMLGNHFTIHVSQTFMLHIWISYSDVCQLDLNKIGEIKRLVIQMLLRKLPTSCVYDRIILPFGSDTHSVMHVAQRLRKFIINRLLIKLIQKISWPQMYDRLIYGFSVLSNWSVCLFMPEPEPHCFDYGSLILSFEIRKYEISSLGLLQGCFHF